MTVSRSGDRVEVRVIDRGTGVPDQDKERIFVPFRRLGDTDNRTGLGLGLALSRGLLEAMQGTLEAEDTPGGGLTMVLSLPAQSDEIVGLVEPGHRERQRERKESSS
jgi:two-component system sensor histidine kinase KdpD